MRSAWIISSGTELALGQSVDTNAAWLAAQLAALGIRAARHVTVPDDVAATRDVLRQAASACDVIVITGGLGPTGDDLTRVALADVAGVALESHAPSVDHLRAFFAARNRPMPPSNTVQAMIPATGTALPNRYGTAPGILISLLGTPCYALPGVPFEMRAMFAAEVGPRLGAAAAGAVILTRTLHTFGLGESELGQRLRDLMSRGRNPEVGTTAAAGLVGVRINAAAPSIAAATGLLDGAEVDVRQRLGEIVVGRDEETMSGVVGKLLLARGSSLSTAESCTGGLIGALLTEVPGCSRYYRGGAVTYSNESKVRVLGVEAETIRTHGAVSAAVARQMAEGAATVFGTEYAIAATGVAGPDGGSADKPVGLVYVGVRRPAGVLVEECHFGVDAPREIIRLRAARTGLNLLRRELLRSA